MAASLPNKFTTNEGAWHFCGRCGDRVPLAQLRWQRGKLLDDKCFDTALLGSIEKRRADAMMTLIQSPDLMPDPKLTMPSLDGVDDSDIFL